MKQIPNYPNYSVDKDGRVWTHKFKRWLHPYPGGMGRLRVSLFINDVPKNQYVHRLVLETYVGPCPAGMQCRHLNGDHQDNRLVNLKWGTRSENMQDAVRHGTHAGLRQGKEHSRSKDYIGRQ